MRQPNFSRGVWLATAMLSMVFLISSCGMNSANPTEWQSKNVALSVNLGQPQLQPNKGNLKGSSGDMPVYYDSLLVTINFKELPVVAENTILLHNRNVNLIYMSDRNLPDDKPFISVINAIPKDDFNPLMRKVQVVFNSGFTPRQLYSEKQTQKAASGLHPEITLVTTKELFRCAVVGQKP